MAKTETETKVRDTSALGNFNRAIHEFKKAFGKLEDDAVSRKDYASAEMIVGKSKLFDELIKENFATLFLEGK